MNFNVSIWSSFYVRYPRTIIYTDDFFWLDFIVIIFDFFVLLIDDIKLNGLRLTEFDLLGSLLAILFLIVLLAFINRNINAYTFWVIIRADNGLARLIQKLRVLASFNLTRKDCSALSEPHHKLNNVKLFA